MHLMFERARHGDPTAKDAVVEFLRPRISSMAAHYARCSGEDPEDLIQEAWMGLLEALRELDVTIGSPEQYLIHHARWRVLDALRRARSHRTLPLEDEDIHPTLSTNTQAVIDGVCVSQFVRQLPGTHRLVLRCLLAGLTWREAGRALGCTSANVAYYVRQIRHRYEDWIEGKVCPNRGHPEP